MKDRNNLKGFTLIEILIAVVILAAALTTFFGLQSSSLQSTIRGSNEIQAVTITRTIMSLIEHLDPPIDVQDRTASAEEIISSLSTGSFPPIDKKTLEPYMAHVVVQYWPFPALDANALKRITVSVEWGAGDQQRLITHYFISGIPDDPQA